MGALQYCSAKDQDYSPSLEARFRLVMKALLRIVCTQEWKRLPHSLKEDMALAFGIRLKKKNYMIFELPSNLSIGYLWVTIITT